MISIGNEITLKFKLGDLEDFVSVYDLKTFLFIEEAGCVLPTFKLIFNTMDENVMKYLNEGADLEVSFGGESLNSFVVGVVCTSVVMHKMGNDSFFVSMVGIYDALDYIIHPQLYISNSPESAIEILNIVMGKYFVIDFDPTSSEDNQIYIQPNISDKKFAQHLLSQAKLSNSAPISGITYGGDFRVRDVKKVASEPYSWKFTKDVQDKAKDIGYESGDILEASSGMINSMYGYGRNIYELNFDDGTSEINTDTSTSVFSNSLTPSRKSSIEERMGCIVPLTENIDPDFYKTNLRNAMYNFTCSQYKKTVRFVNLYRDIKVLDLVMYQEISVMSDSTLEYTSGLYIVTKVVRNISAGFLQTTCEICRESLNNPDGDNR
jgi:hypothetical protein